MHYDFDSVIDRRGTNSMKWNIGDDELPMWVADMDFATAPAITEAVLGKALSGVFGYGVVPDSFYTAIEFWWASRYGWMIPSESIQFCVGVMPAVSSLIRTFTLPGDAVVVQAPVYNCFYTSIEQCKRRVLVNNLRYADGHFSIDWVDLEHQLSDPYAKILLLCNPQNPTGQIWNAGDLARIGALAASHGVIVVSDEIHGDITEPGRSYVPFASVDPTCANNSITLISPTKPFNIPGLQTSALITSNPDLRVRVATGLKRDELVLPNSFAIEATIAAYTRGGAWLDQMRTYVWANKSRLTDFARQQLPQMTVIPSQATYLSWIDCTRLAPDADHFARFLREQTGLVVNAGRMYGPNSAAFIRLNLACPQALLDDGLHRLARGLTAWLDR